MKNRTKGQRNHLDNGRSDYTHNSLFNIKINNSLFCYSSEKIEVSSSIRSESLGLEIQLTPLTYPEPNTETYSHFYTRYTPLILRVSKRGKYNSSHHQPSTDGCVLDM